MTPDTHLTTRIALDEADLVAAERLRYRVFVEELGGDGPLVDHATKRERDRFDEYFQHLVLIDERRDPAELDHVVGVYRLLDDGGAQAAGQFYSEDEYDLTVLRATGRPLLELGRSCLDADYRGGTGMHRLWTALAAHVAAKNIGILFGVASFHGTDPAPVAPSLTLLHDRHLAPPDLRVRARDTAFQRMDLLPPEEIDRARAMRDVPALIKAYLRIGGSVGEGAFIDRDFNTLDVCLVLDTERMAPRASALYRGAA